MSYQHHNIHSHHNSCLSVSTTTAAENNAASPESSQHSRKDGQKPNSNDKKTTGNAQSGRINNDSDLNKANRAQNNRHNSVVNAGGNNNRSNNRVQPSSSRSGTRETQHVTYGIDSGNNYKYVADYHNNAITPSKIIQSPFNDGKQKIQFSGNNKLVVLSPGGPNQNSGQTHFIITQQPTNISNITGNLGNSNSIGEHFVATINDQQHIVLDASQLHTGLTPKPGQNFTFPGRMNGDYQTIAIQGQHGEIITESQLATTPDGKTFLIQGNNHPHMPLLKQEHGSPQQMLEVDNMGRSSHSPGAASNITTLHDGHSQNYETHDEDGNLLTGSDKGKHPRTYTRDPRHGMGIMKEANYRDRRKEQNKKAQANMRERKRKELEIANKQNSVLVNENSELKAENDKHRAKIDHLNYLIEQHKIKCPNQQIFQQDFGRDIGKREMVGMSHIGGMNQGGSSMNLPTSMSGNSVNNINLNCHIGNLGGMGSNHHQNLIISSSEGRIQHNQINIGGNIGGNINQTTQHNIQNQTLSHQLQNQTMMPVVTSSGKNGNEHIFVSPHQTIQLISTPTNSMMPIFTPNTEKFFATENGGIYRAVIDESQPVNKSLTLEESERTLTSNNGNAFRRKRNASGKAPRGEYQRNASIAASEPMPLGKRPKQEAELSVVSGKRPRGAKPKPPRLNIPDESMADEIESIHNRNTSYSLQKLQGEPETPQIISDMIKQLPSTNEDENNRLENIGRMCDKEISEVEDESSSAAEMVKVSGDGQKSGYGLLDQVTAIKDSIEVTEQEDARKDKVLGVKKDGGNKKEGKKENKVQGIDLLLAAANKNEKNDKDSKFKQPIRTPNVTNQLHNSPRNMRNTRRKPDTFTFEERDKSKTTK